jgi:hypothetical protein
MNRRVSLLLLLLASLSIGPASAQTTPQATLAERLGYPRGARLLILHADDVGMSHSINRATLQALDTGAIRAYAAGFTTRLRVDRMILPRRSFVFAEDFCASHGSRPGMELWR